MLYSKLSLVLNLKRQYLNIYTRKYIFENWSLDSNTRHHASETCSLTIRTSGETSARVCSKSHAE